MSLVHVISQKERVLPYIRLEEQLFEGKSPAFESGAIIGIYPGDVWSNATI